jgi:phenylpropionate dioxygenase-like ring-hydroxylating dioxygenase large terminal subunit
MEAPVPWSWYSDPEVLRLEQERVFARAWQYVGHSGQVTENGTYFTSSVGALPVVVTRDREGRLNAFANVCRHRGFQVAVGEGARETLQCGYHAWTYDLDGSLRAAPRANREQGFDADELSLRRIQVDAWGPFLFANPDLGAPPLADTLRDLPEQVVAVGIDVDGLEFRLRSEFSVDANWKIVCENFLECYHCAVAHPGFTGLVDVAPDSYRLEIGETFSSQRGPLRENGRAAYDAAGEVGHSQFHFIWPSTGINIFPGKPNLSIGPMIPAGPARTDRFLDYFFGQGVDRAWVDELLAFDDQIGREDRALVEGVQRGVSAGAIERGKLLAESEQLVADFQRRVVAALASD